MVLSKLIEFLLSSLTNRHQGKSIITPWLESLSGVIDLPDGFDEKQAYAEYLTEKYR